PPAPWGKFVAPRVGCLLKPAPRGKFPFRLSRQAFTGPVGVRKRIIVRDLHDWIVIFARDRTVRALRMAPIRSWNVPPPEAVVAQIDGSISADEYHGAGNQGVIRRSRCTVR